MKAKLIAFVTGASLCMAAGSARAHTISLGTYNAGSAGSVTVTLGTYNHGIGAEGAITLTSGPGIPPSVGPISFGSLTFSKPAALIDGTNNFFASGIGTSPDQGEAL